MRNKILLFFSLQLFVITVIFSTQIVYSQDAVLTPEGKFQRATPESQGISTETIIELIQKMDREINTMNSLMILRHGKVVAEVWWAPHTSETPHAMYSISKSYTSTAIGLAVKEGKLSIDTPVLDYFKDRLPANISDNLKNMKIRHPLSMSCGHQSEAQTSLFEMNRCPEDVAKKPEDWVERFLNQPVPFEPGTHFCYNTLGTYMCGVILQKATGETLPEYLDKRLFQPLHIKRPFWEVSPQGIVKGGSGLFLRTEDMAKLGQLYLQKGRWNGQQLLTANWVEQATSKQISNGDNPENDWNQGYGFQFWRCRHNTFRGDGAHCQFIVVMPEKDTVIVSTADHNNYQGILNYYWDMLLPAIKDNPLPENPNAQKQLKQMGSILRAKDGTTGSHVRTDLVFDSKILKREVKYTVYFPTGYITSGFTYPILYLAGPASDWLDAKKGNLKKAADQYFTEKPLKKVIIVMPQAEVLSQNQAEQKQWTACFYQELIPHVETAWRGRANQNFRFIAGLENANDPVSKSISENTTMFHSIKKIKQYDQFVDILNSLDRKSFFENNQHVIK